MKELSIKRNLCEETRRQGLLIEDRLYSLHITEKEAIITDNSDFEKIYSVQSIEFFNLITYGKRFTETD